MSAGLDLNTSGPQKLPPISVTRGGTIGALLSFGLLRKEVAFTIDAKGLDAKSPGLARRIIELTDQAADAGTSQKDKNQIVEQLKKLSKNNALAGLIDVQEAGFASALRTYLADNRDGITSFFQKNNLQPIRIEGKTIFKDGSEAKWLAVKLENLNSKYLEALGQGNTEAGSAPEWLKEKEAELAEKLGADVDWDDQTLESSSDVEGSPASKVIKYFKEVFGDNVLEIITADQIGIDSLKLDNSEPDKAYFEKELSLVSASLEVGKRNSADATYDKIAELSDQGLIVVPTFNPEELSTSIIGVPEKLDVKMLIFDPMEMDQDELQRFSQAAANLCKSAESGIISTDDAGNAAAIESLRTEFGHALVSNKSSDGDTDEDLDIVRQAAVHLQENAVPIELKDLDKAEFEAKPGQKLLKAELGGAAILRDGLEAVSFSIPDGSSVAELVEEGKLPADFEANIEKGLNGETIGRAKLSLAAYLGRVAKDGRADLQQVCRKPLELNTELGLNLKLAVEICTRSVEEDVLRDYGRGDGGMAAAKQPPDELATFGRQVLEELVITSHLKASNKPSVVAKLESLIAAKDFDPAKLEKLEEELELIRRYGNLYKRALKQELEKEGRLAELAKISKVLDENRSLSEVEVTELENLIYLLKEGYVTDNGLARPLRRGISRQDNSSGYGVDHKFSIRLYKKAAAGELETVYEDLVTRCLALKENHDEDYNNLIRELKEFAKRAREEIFSSDELNYLAASKLSKEIKAKFDGAANHPNLKDVAEELVRSVNLAGVGFVPVRDGEGKPVDRLMTAAQVARARVMEELSNLSLEGVEVSEYRQFILDLLSRSTTKRKIAGDGFINITGVPVRQIERVIRAIELDVNVGETEGKALLSLCEKLVPKNRTDFKQQNLEENTFEKILSDETTKLEKLAAALKDGSPLKGFLVKILGELGDLKPHQRRKLQKLLIKAYKKDAAEQEATERDLREICKRLERLYAYRDQLSYFVPTQLTIEPEGREPLVYFYPELDALKRKNAAAFKIISKIKDLVDQGRHSEAERELRNQEVVLAGVLRKNDSTELEKDFDTDEFAFLNEYGVLETWQFDSRLLDADKSSDLAFQRWELRSFIDLGQYKKARQLLESEIGGGAGGQSYTCAKQIGFEIPNEYLIRFGDGRCVSVSFDGASFDWTIDDRDKVHSITELQEVGKGDQGKEAKREKLLGAIQGLVHSINQDEPFDSLKLAKSIQSSFKKGKDGQWLVRVSPMMSKEQGDEIVNRHLYNAKAKSGTDPMIEEGRIVFPISRDHEQVVEFNKNIPDDEEGRRFKRELNLLLVKMKGLTPLHHQSDLTSIWQDIKEMFDGWSKYDCKPPVEQVIGPNSHLTMNKAQAFFDVYEIHRITGGIFPVKNESFIEHVEELRKLIFGTKNRTHLTDKGFKTALEVLKKEFDDPANRANWTDCKEQIEVINEVYKSLIGYQSIDAFTGIVDTDRVKEEFAKTAKFQPELTRAFVDIFKKLSLAFESPKTVGLNKTKCRVTYTHEQGFLIEFKQGGKKCKLKLGDRLSGAAEILDNAEIILNLLNKDKDCKLTVERGKVGFDKKSRLGQWISGESQFFTFEKGSFELQLPREDPSWEEILTFPKDKDLLLKVREAADDLHSGLRYGQNIADICFSRRQVELLRQDLQVLLTDGEVEKSAKNFKAVEQMEKLCGLMLEMESIRHEARKDKMTKTFDVPVQSKTFEIGADREQSNKKQPISTLDTEAALQQLEAAFGTEKEPKITGLYKTYVKYVDDRGPRVVCIPIKSPSTFRGKVSFAIHVGQPAAGIEKWLRHGQLIFNALQEGRAPFFRTRTDICKRELKLFANKFFKLGDAYAAIKKEGFASAVKTRVKKALEKAGIFCRKLAEKPIETILSIPKHVIGQTLLLPFTVLKVAGFGFTLVSHKIPFWTIDTTSKFLNVVFSRFAKAELSPDSDLWKVINNGDNGMGMKEVTNFDFRDINLLGSEAFIKSEIKNCKFVGCRLSGSSWEWSKLHNVSFKMHDGLTGFVERIPFLNKLLWPMGKHDHRVQARSMVMQGIKWTGAWSTCARADMRDTDFEYACGLNMRMTGAWLDGVKSNEMTRWGFMYPPGYEAMKRIPILGQAFLIPIARWAAFGYYMEGCHRGEGDKWQGFGNPEKRVEKLFGESQYGPSNSMIEYESFVDMIKDAAPFLSTKRTRVPNFLQQYVAKAKDYTIIDNEGCKVKFLVTWDGATNRVLAFIDTPEFWEKAERVIKAPRHLNRYLTVKGGGMPRALEKKFAHIAKVVREDPTGDNNLPELVREFYAVDESLDEDTRYQMEKMREARAMDNVYGHSSRDS